MNRQKKKRRNKKFQLKEEQKIWSAISDKTFKENFCHNKKSSRRNLKHTLSEIDGRKAGDPLILKLGQSFFTPQIRF
jgi:hypothetical protein